MKKIFTLPAAFSLMLVLTSSLCNAQSANTSLSNLASPTSINQNLLPKSGNQFTLGNSAKGWKKLFISDGLYNHAFRIFKADSTNTGVGSNALIINTGKVNTAVGSNALYSNTAGSLNTALGASALVLNSTGVGNTATGADALYSNINGNFNTASGYFSLASNIAGSYNVAIGNYALYSNTTGYSNVGIGTRALYKNQTSSHSIAIGDSALLNNVSENNTAVGSEALLNNSLGTSNTAFGALTLNSNINGNSNTALGSYALIDEKHGSGNTAVGRSALILDTSGNSNVAVGYFALGNNYAGNYNTALGYAADVTMLVNNSAAIGAHASVDASNKVRIGNTAIISIGGQVGWTTFSDGRYKKNIKENVPGLDFINALRPVTYTVDINGLNNYFKAFLHNDSSKVLAQSKADLDLKGSYDKAAKIIHTGFIAQEVEAVANKLGYDFSGVDKPETKDKLYGLRYDEFVVPLVKAVQELSKKNDEKDARIDTLQKEIDELKAMIVSNRSAGNSQKSIVLSSASLQQNIPNPYKGTTVINYTLPAVYSNAQIIITDKNGKTLNRINVNGKGNGSLKLNTVALASGVYNYSLMIDGKLIETKQMELLK